MNKILPDHLHDEVVKVRRDLHRIPETAFKENETSNYIKNYLKLNSINFCLLYTSPSPRDRTRSRMPSSA